MTTAARQETALLVTAVSFTVATISIALWGQNDSTDVFTLLRASAVVSWIVLTIVVGTNRVVQQVRASAGQVRAEVKAARELAMSEIHTLYERLGDKVAAAEFERRLAEAEEGKPAGIAYLHQHGFPKGAQNT